MYELIGAVLGWIIREIFYVPLDFHWGIIVVSGLFLWVWNVMIDENSVAPCRTGVSLREENAYHHQRANDQSTYLLLLCRVLEITRHSSKAMSSWVSPTSRECRSVNEYRRQTLTVLSVFSFVFCIVMFPLGLHKVCDVAFLGAPFPANIQLCALDFQEANLNRAEPASFSQKWAERIAWFRNWRRRRLNNSTAPVPETPGIIESFDDKHDGSSTDHGEIDSDPAALSTNRRNEKASAAVDGRVPGRRQARSTSFNSIRPIPPTAPLDAAGINDPCPAPCCPTISTIAPSDPSLLASTSLALAPPAPLLPTCSNHGPLHAYHEPNQPSIAPSLTWKAKVKRIGNEFVKGLIMPVSIAVIVSIPCALIQPIKALFTPVPGWTGGRISDAPDGRPPLAWLLETATFIGGICIPAGLLLLGAGFARLKVGGWWCMMMRN